MATLVHDDIIDEAKLEGEKRLFNLNTVKIIKCT